MNGFQGDPEGLMQKGNRIKNIFSNYTNVKNSIYRIVDNVASNWTGADSAGYVTQIRGYEVDFKNLGAIIEQIADILFRHGQRMASSRDAIKSAASRLQ